MSATLLSAVFLRSIFRPPSSEGIASIRPGDPGPRQLFLGDFSSFHRRGRILPAPLRCPDPRALSSFSNRRSEMSYRLSQKGFFFCLFRLLSGGLPDVQNNTKKELVMTQNYNNSSSLRRFRYGSRNLFLARPLGSRAVKISGADGRALGRQRHNIYIHIYIYIYTRLYVIQYFI